MLPIEECKKIIGIEVPDKEVEAVRDSLYAIATSVLDHLDTHVGDLKTPPNHVTN